MYVASRYDKSHTMTLATLGISLRDSVPIVTVMFPDNTSDEALDSLELLLRAAFSGFEALLGHPYIVVLDTSAVSLLSMVSPRMRQRFVRMYADIYENIKVNVHSSVVVLSNALIRVVFDMVIASKKKTASEVTTCSTPTEAAAVAKSIVPIVALLRSAVDSR